jgi:uncharacterized protein YjiK
MLRAPLIAVLLAATQTTTEAQISSVDLSTYSLVQTINLPANPLLEASAMTYNWDTNRLIILPDSTTGVFELSLSGVMLSQMSLSGWEDTEGITYLGAGRYAIAEERQQRVYRFSYTPGGTLVRSSLLNAALGSPIGNEGIEGISFEPATGFTFAVKEKTPIRVLRTTIDYKAGNASIIDLFSPASLGVADLADLCVLSTVPSLVGTADQDNLLLLSQASARLLEVSRTGSVLSELDLDGISTNAEGVTIDPQGTIYICDEVPRIYIFKPPAPCYGDCDGAGGLTANDFACFLNAYANNLSYANCDHVGGLTPNDFACFLNAYSSGCS